MCSLKENPKLKQELGVLERIDAAAKGKGCKCCKRMRKMVERKKGGLFLGSSVGWDVADAWEGNEGLFGLDRKEVEQSIRMAARRRKLVGGTPKGKKEFGGGKGGGGGGRYTAPSDVQVNVNTPRTAGRPFGPLPSDLCNRCGAQGHWARECPSKGRRADPQRPPGGAGAGASPPANPG